MRKLTLPVLGMLSSVLFTLPATAQQIDNTQILPDAKPGECYAKVITPAQFTTKTEEVVVQEASERIETIEAKYEKVDRTIVIKEPSQLLTASGAEFAKETRKVEVLAASKSWTTKAGNKTLPASPDAIAQIASSGVDTDAVDPGGCFVEYFEAAKYKTEVERVMVKPGSCLLYTSPSPRDGLLSRMPSSA